MPARADNWAGFLNPTSARLPLATVSPRPTHPSLTDHGSGSPQHHLLVTSTAIFTAMAFDVPAGSALEIAGSHSSLKYPHCSASLLNWVPSWSSFRLHRHSCLHSFPSFCSSVPMMQHVSRPEKHPDPSCRTLPPSHGLLQPTSLLLRAGEKERSCCCYRKFCEGQAVLAKGFWVLRKALLFC